MFTATKGGKKGRKSIKTGEVTRIKVKTAYPSQ